MTEGMDLLENHLGSFDQAIKREGEGRFCHSLCVMGRQPWRLVNPTSAWACD